MLHIVFIPPLPVWLYFGLHLTGTTDSPCDLTDYPMPSEDDIQFILKEIRNYLSPDVEGKFTLLQSGVHNNYNR